MKGLGAFKWAERIELKSGPAIAIRFKNGESLYVSFNANDQLMIVSTTSKLDWHHCANGALSISPTLRLTAIPKQDAAPEQKEATR